MDDESFFAEMKDQSKAKLNIVNKYFLSWTKIISPRTKRLAYVDLFAGRGFYEDGTPSTPIEILQQAIEREDLCEKLITVFNDINHASSLKSSIFALNNISHLTHQPIVWSESVCEDILCKMDFLIKVPTLLFIDPFGYKLSLIHI